MTKITVLERMALIGLEGTHDKECFRYFRTIAERGGLRPDQVRRAVRAVARKGLAVYSRGLWDEYGPAGAGYALTAAGRAMLEQIQKQKILSDDA